MKLMDLHNHTSFSYDGISGINCVVENAINNDVSYLGITDHEFSIEKKLPEYVDALLVAKEKYKGKINLLAGIEIGTRPAPDDLCISLVNKLDYCLFESLDSDRAMNLYDFLEWRKKFRCKVGLAHTDIFALGKRYNINMLEVMKKEDIFWEINFSGNYNYYFDFISNQDKRDAVKKSGISISVGSDLHWIGDFDKTRLIQTNELARSLGNPLAFGIRD